VAADYAASSRPVSGDVPAAAESDPARNGQVYDETARDEQTDRDEPVYDETAVRGEPVYDETTDPATDESASGRHTRRS
jgi:hypothetical protein